MDKINVATIILAGGQGTRLSPLTSKRCKPDVLFGGRYRLIDIPLSASINSGIGKIFVISQYLASHLNNYIKETYKLSPHSKIDLTILSPEETKIHTWYNGTADAVRKNLDNILEAPADYYLILSGDHLYSMDLQDLISFAVSKNADLTIASIPVGKGDATRMGLLKVDSNMAISHFVEKPKEEAILKEYLLPKHHAKGSFFTYEDCYLGSMGIYVFKKETLVELLKNQKGDDFGHDLIPYCIGSGARVSAYIYKGYWEDIGTVSSYYMATMALLRGDIGLNFYDESNPIYSQIVNLPCPKIESALIQKSIICDGSIIEAKEVTSSLIGLRVHILKESVIRDSIIMGNPHHEHTGEHTIGECCHLERVIMDEGSQIGHHVTLINKDQIQNLETSLFSIRDGIIVVKAGCKIPDHYTLDHLAA
jgi:glucose-1-phosphate adenylyltransferase